MSYGIIEYNEEGKPMCEICGKYFDRVIAHARQKHFINEKEYKKSFGLDLRKGICSRESSEKSRERVFENYHKSVEVNLISKGKRSRFTKGSEGRTKEKVSEQTRIMLKERLKTKDMVESMKESGRRVGLSGLGNIKRWGKNE